MIIFIFIVCVCVRAREYVSCWRTKAGVFDHKIISKEHSFLPFLSSSLFCCVPFFFRGGSSVRLDDDRHSRCTVCIFMYGSGDDLC